MPIPSLVFDLVALAIIMLCAAFYARKGFVAGLFSFFGTLIALVTAGLAARWLAPAIFDLLFRPGLERNMAATIQEYGINSVGELLGKVMGFLPEHILLTIEKALDTHLDFAATDIAVAAVDNVMLPILVPIITVVLFFLLFSLVRILVGVLRSLAVTVSKIPAISSVNSLLGAVVGIFIGFLYVFIVLCVVWAYDYINPATSLAANYLSNSFVLKLLSPLNIFTKL